MSYEELWFRDVLDGGRAPFPVGQHTCDLEVVPRGSIDVPSGSLRLDTAHRFRHAPPLDLDVVSGSWSITALRDRDDELDLGILLLRARSSEVSTVVQWTKATRQGREFQLPTHGLLLGDSSVPDVLGDDAFGEHFPMMGLVQQHGLEWAWPAGDATGLLLPGSVLRSYYSADEGINSSPPRTHRPGRAQAWLGVDAQGRGVELVVDLASVYRARPYEIVEDAWATVVDEGPARLTSDVGLSPETADVGGAFVQDDESWGELLGLGKAHLQGRLCGFDPRYLKNPVQLPVVVPEGDYPAYVLLQDAADLLLLRLGPERPRRWVEYRRPSGSDHYIQIETGAYVLAAAETWHAIAQDEVLREEMRQAASDLVLDVGQLESLTGAGFVLNGVTMGDMPAWCYLGLTDGGEVSAVAVALVTDVIYGHRPATDDAILKQQLEVRIARVDPADDPEELRSYLWPAVEEAIAADGKVSRATRVRMHQLKEYLDDHEAARRGT